MKQILAAFLLALLGTLAQAQSYPDYTDTAVNDFADLLPTNAEAQLRAQIMDLRRETGVELALVTLDSQAPFAPGETLENFATGLFNDWGIGDATRNDGILVLILRRDRNMRIELGAAYGRDWDRAAERVIDRYFLPAFREDNYVGGITGGVAATVAEIAQPFATGADAPEGGGMKPGWIVGIIAAIAALYLGINRFFDRGGTCPQCGARGALVVDRHATGNEEARETVSCSRCDHQTSRVIPLYMLERQSSTSHRSGGGFGGGSSGGGGASGSW